ncbi:MAG: hypothetical protein JNM39_15680 [Bdellovibrionaceae bacterium]|nr:hypothetical protein [Pseudobdellovibrionaceae bacterium]
MKSQIGVLIWFILFLGAFRLGAQLVKRQIPLRSAFQDICHKVNSKIYLSTKQLSSWPRDCLEEAQKIEANDDVVQVTMRANSFFSRLKVSHLGVFGPSEVQRVWKSQYRTTGIQSKYVDGEVVVVDLVPNSPALRAGLRRGDLLKTINGELAQVAEAETEAGVYGIVRKGRAFDIKIETAELQVDDHIQWKRLDAETTLITVPSFRIEFFEDQLWKDKIQSQIKKTSRVIVDLRQNHGGNFVAGMRFLSSFLCEPKIVGRLYKPKGQKARDVILSDDSMEDSQVSLLANHDEVKLQSFPDYGCLKTKLVVLVGAQTASTAEIVAEALRDFAGARILGASSAGLCLVGIWYPLPAFGAGYMISIPEAVYETGSGRLLEGDGVQIDKTLYENLEDYIRGQDSLVEQAHQVLNAAVQSKK